MIIFALALTLILTPRNTSNSIEASPLKSIEQVKCPISKLRFRLV
ncbi:hypothetical protein EV11_1580 [Prochlorococcus sp. SS52]|nr:hypothetical protein EV04_0781 [Prochlorococcus marinus str. LG]KGG18830.1 hypothetical protein EV08_1316 [Prochlorococcus marinus str. SS2]KGG23632.1 hypothetical protein EV09_1257 [Prochlorococcus marinus str. SS35]KGG32132.1 hypothetical protein EV10_1246 [Prochlorococcus marinus str. SS51]KGG35177.1 hypothetical protein EV11_1580 [Prochlorococcus sp. SS52]